MPPEGGYDHAPMPPDCGMPPPMEVAGDVAMAPPGDMGGQPGPMDPGLDPPPAGDMAGDGGMGALVMPLVAHQLAIQVLRRHLMLRMLPMRKRNTSHSERLDCHKRPQRVQERDVDVTDCSSQASGSSLT